MKTHVLIYEEFAQFEVIFATYFLRTVGDIITVGITDEPVTSGEGYVILPDMTVDELATEDVEVLIIPGGDPSLLYGCEDLYELIAEVKENGAVLAAICAGVVHLGKAGILEGAKYTTTVNPADYDVLDASSYVDENVVVSEKLITAKAQGYLDFAIELGQMLGIYKDEDDLNETIDFFKHYK